MDRRTFLTLTAAAALAPLAAQAFSDYTPGAVSKALDNGETVFLAFNTDWCSTCAAQKRVIDTLIKQNPDYDKNIKFINVDWDKYETADLTKSLRIPRRSTLVALKGNKELGRIVAGTSQTDIKALMDAALIAAKG